MKKMFIILTLILFSCYPSKYKYMIKDERGNRYLCNVYNISGDGCIMFNDKPGYEGTPGYPTRVCKPYTIKKLK